ncbi:MAG: VanZ family protein [Polaribacter sp.]|nr:VanZ family protein [Polaribacter sp.]
MQKLIRTLFKDNITYIAILITLGVALLSLIKLGGGSVNIIHIDKLEHAFAYCVLTLSWLLAIKKAAVKARFRYVIALGCLFYGMIIEVLQEVLTTYRTGSFLDILANFVGISMALLLFKFVYKKINAI